VTDNFAGREQACVIGTDREADRDDHADRSDRVDRSGGRWNGVAAFALALVASLIPVSWVVSDGTGGKRVGGTSDTGGGTGVEIVDALPLDVGLTDPSTSSATRFWQSSRAA